MPRPKFMLRNTRTLTPSTETVSRSRVPARMRMPRRVQLRIREQADHRDGDDRHHEHPVSGEEEIVTRQRRHQPAWHLKRQALCAPNKARAILDDKSKPKGEQQAVERIAPIEAADEHSLDSNADDRGQDRRKDQGPPKSDIGDHREGEIAADREKPAMGEIDHPGQVEDERQAERHQRIERADDQAIENVEQDDLCHVAVL